MPGGTASREAEFNNLWKTYPHYGRRSSKARSLARWLALRPRPAIEAVLSGLAAAKKSEDWTKDGGRFVPAMEVWVGKRGWDASNGAEAGPGERVDELANARRLLAEMEADDAAGRSR